uniref:Uncharacterized protein n=1 Tax=Arundo donax TaxID=35708 RepID=A0A0A8ZYT3_ARUDO
MPRCFYFCSSVHCTSKFHHWCQIIKQRWYWSTETWSEKPWLHFNI